MNYMGQGFDDSINLCSVFGSMEHVWRHKRETGDVQGGPELWTAIRYMEKKSGSI